MTSNRPYGIPEQLALDDASNGPERETSHSSCEKENRATEPDHYRCVPDRPHPCECGHRAQSNSDLEQGNAVGKSVMLMHQMVAPGGLLIALSFLFAGDPLDCNLLAGVALALVGE